MIFTSFVYVYFFIIVFISYWLIRKKTYQNILLLVASYVFYGWIHPWFCILIASSTIIDYFCGLGMKTKKNKKIFLIISLVANLGMLGFFKYFNFFADNVHTILTMLGLQLSPWTLQIFLPVGISFYTFQTLSYTIDIYRGELEARKNFIDFAVFVSFFPQLVAGPIERAKRFLPQIEQNRIFNREIFSSAIPLIIRGYFKKMVIADNVSIYVDKIFMLENPDLFLLFVGGLAFTLQIFADFSAYTDIARGMARLLGFDLIKNFNAPYLAISPSDFWRRWHISFSSWIRDYLYISLGGSRVNKTYKFAIVLIVTMGLSGLWHGAAWNFVIWGLYHGILVFLYHKMGMGGRWCPIKKTQKVLAWFLMFLFTVFGWMIFRAYNVEWLFNVFYNFNLLGDSDAVISAISILIFVLIYSIPTIIFLGLDTYFTNQKWLHYIVYGFALILIVIFFRESAGDFIYFQF